MKAIRSSGTSICWLVWMLLSNTSTTFFSDALVVRTTTTTTRKTSTTSQKTPSSSFSWRKATRNAAAPPSFPSGYNKEARPPTWLGLSPLQQNGGGGGVGGPFSKNRKQRKRDFLLSPLRNRALLNSQFGSSRGLPLQAENNNDNFKDNEGEADALASSLLNITQLAQLESALVSLAVTPTATGGGMSNDTAGFVSASSSVVETEIAPLQYNVQWWNVTQHWMGVALEKVVQFWQRIQTAVLAFSAGLVFATAALLLPIYHPTAEQMRLLQPVTLFETILSDIESNYVDPVDVNQLFETGMAAMLQSLDPYTEFEGPQEAQAVLESIEGRYGGVGLVIAGAVPNNLPSAAAVVAPATSNKEVTAPSVLPSTSPQKIDDVDGGQKTLKDGDMSTSTMPMNNVNQNSVDGLDAEKDLKLDRFEEADEDDDEVYDSRLREQDKRRYQRAAAQGIRVVTAFEGYAFDYGMRPGDRLVAVDEKVITERMTVEDVRNALRGEPGSWVTIQFERDGVDGIQTVSMPRTVVRIRDVKLATLLPNTGPEKIGYIRVAAFSSDTGAQVRNAIMALQRAAEDSTGGEQTLDGLIIDLRGNPGGLLTSAVDVSSLLVPKGSDIVSAKGRGFPGILYRSRVDPIVDPAHTKLAVLVNGQTASAAEIVSGAVQDLDAGVVVGSGRTYGKGLVQNVESLPYDTALKFTVAKYYTPSGRCIQGINYREGVNGDTNGGRYSATKVAEKDRSIYYTKGGRVVKDGGGIEADYRVDAPKASALEITLLRAGVLNDFAAQWSKTHKLPDYYRNQRLEVVDDDTYREFVAFCKEKQKSGELELDALYRQPLRELRRTLKQSGYAGSEKSVEQLQARIVRDMEDDFIKYRGDLMEDLSQSILARYLPESMLLERGVERDVQVKAAIQLLRHPTQYNQLLARNSGSSDDAGVASSLNLAQQTTTTTTSMADEIVQRVRNRAVSF